MILWCGMLWQIHYWFMPPSPPPLYSLCVFFSLPECHMHHSHFSYLPSSLRPLSCSDRPVQNNYFRSFNDSILIFSQVLSKMLLRELTKLMGRVHGEINIAFSFTELQLAKEHIELTVGQNTYSRFSWGK